MTSPLFDLPAQQPTDHPVVAAARRQIRALEEAGAITEATQLTGAMMLHLAGQIASAPAYAVADLSRQVLALQQSLPQVTAGDDWSIPQLLGRLIHPGGPAPEARYATPADPTARHHLPAVHLAALTLGHHLMPWQEQVARVATERTPDDTAWRYRRVVVTVPRQCGKTTLLGAIQVARAAARKNTRSWMTAQTGRDAQARWNDIRQAVMEGPLAAYATQRLSSGDSRLTLPAGFLAPFAPTKKSLHGYTISDASIDEAFGLTEADAADLLGAIDPAMSTIPDSQLYLISTEGNRDSTWWAGLLDELRTECPPDTAFFDWGAPEGAAEDDWSWHPAIGHTQTVETMEMLRTRTPKTEFQRAFRNCRVLTSEDPFVDLTDLEATARGDQPRPAPGQLIVVSPDIARDRSRATIAAAWLDPDGVTAHTMIVMSREGCDWVQAALTRMIDPEDGLGTYVRIAIDDTTTTRLLIEALDKAGTPYTPLGARDWAVACSDWLHRVITTHTITHQSIQPILDAAKATETKPLGEGWAISRQRSTGMIDPLTATIAAVRGLALADTGPSLHAAFA